MDEKDICKYFQEPALFSCSIADNIKYGATDPSTVTMEMVENAAKQANAHVFIKSFQTQYDTLVGERGVMLSGEFLVAWTIDMNYLPSSPKF